MMLRPRQREFVTRCVTALKAHGNTLGVAPTGAGKTICLSGTAGEFLQHPDAKVCVLAQRDELTAQNLAKFGRVNLSSINRCINLLEGICPEAIARLQDKQFTPDVTRVLRNMKAARQVEAVELMVASNTITVAHADALLKATPPEQRTDFKPTDRDRQLAPFERIVKLEKEMSQVQTQYKDAEENYGSDLLNLVVAKGYLTKLLGNEAVKSYIIRHEPEILEHFELVVNTVSMEEAVQQQLEADGEFE